MSVRSRAHQDYRMTYGATTSDLDLSRALLGDTSNDAATELLTDAHITAILTLYSFNGGVAFLARELVTRFAQEPSSVGLPGPLGTLSVSWAERVKAWEALATNILRGAITGPPSVLPYVGGISITDKQTIEADTDRVAPKFTKDLDMELPPNDPVLTDYPI